MDQDEIDDIKFEVATRYIIAVGCVEHKEHLKASIYVQGMLQLLNLLPPGNEDFAMLYRQRCNDLN